MILNAYLYPINLFAQSGWFWQNPLIQDNLIYEVSFMDAKNRTKVEWLGEIIKKTDTRQKQVIQTIETREYFLKDSFTYVNNDTVIEKVIWKPFDSQTIALQSLAGLGSGAIILLPQPASSNTGLGEGLFVIAQSIGAAVAIALAVYFTGEAMDGDGNYLLTLLGGLLGGGLALIPNISAGTGDQDAAKIRALILSVAGSVLGYHWSASSVVESRETEIQSLKNILGNEGRLNNLIPEFYQNDFQITLLSLQF